MSQRDYIEAVLGSQVGNAVMGLRDRPGPKGKVNRYWDFKYPEQLDEMVKFADDHKNEDLYISPLVYGEDRNPENGKVRRTPENALTSQTIYQDSDTCPPEKFRLKPSIHVTSSAGKYQDFWVLNEPIPAHRAAEISHKIATAHKDDGSDPSSWSANKVLRVPFSVNTSHGFPEDVTVQYSGLIYDASDIEGAYDDVELVERPILRLPADVSYDSDQDLPDYSDALDKLPQNFNIELLMQESKEGSDRSRMRYRLLCDLFRTGTLSFEEVLSLAWHAPVSRKWKEDSRNIRGLIAEALKAQSEVAYDTGEGLTPEGEDEAPVPPSSLALLRDSEREKIAGDENWLRRWDEWNRVKLGRAYNGPYVRMNGLSILSAAFSDCGFIPRGNGPEYLNLFTIAVGDSGSGKTSALKLYSVMLNELFDMDSGWNIGTNASPNALHEKLIERDNKVSIFNADEAHGWFKQVNNNQWADGIYEALAKYFDGDVPSMLRTTNREISGKTAKTFFLMHLMGTMKGELSITQVVTKSMFLSGFLARVIWFIGDPGELTEESMEETQTQSDYVKLGYEPMAKQWAAEFANTKKLLRAQMNRKMIPMLMDRESLQRMGEVKWKMVSLLKDHRAWDIIEPSVRRIGPNIRRVASLLALEEGSATVTLRHTLLAIEAAEEWLRSLVVMADKVSDSEWKRLTDEIYSFVDARGGKISLEVLNRRFDSRRQRDLNEQLEALKAQGRFIEKSESGKKWLMINR